MTDEKRSPLVQKMIDICNEAASQVENDPMTDLLKDLDALEDDAELRRQMHQHMNPLLQGRMLNADELVTLLRMMGVPEHEIKIILRGDDINDTE